MREASQATERFSLACHDGSRLRPRSTSPRLASLRLVRSGSSPHLPTSITPHLTPPRLVEPPSPTRATARPQWATRTASNLNRPGPAPGPSAPNSPRPPAPRRGSGKQASDRTLRLRLRMYTGCAATSASPCATMSMPTYHRASESRSLHFPFGAVCSLGFWNPTGDWVCQLEPKGRYSQVASGFRLFVALQVLNPASFGVSQLTFQAEGEGAAGAPGGLACSVHGHGPLCTAGPT
jgi:hypothetical protein